MIEDRTTQHANNTRAAAKTTGRNKEARAHYLTIYINYGISLWARWMWKTRNAAAEATMPTIKHSSNALTTKIIFSAVRTAVATVLPFLFRKRESSRYTLPWTDSLLFFARSLVVICIVPFEIFGNTFFSVFFFALTVWLFARFIASLALARYLFVRDFFASLSHMIRSTTTSLSFFLPLSPSLTADGASGIGGSWRGHTHIRTPTLHR